MRRLYCGDCLEVMEKRIEPESVDLIYLDPPFFSNRHYEVIWGDEAEIRSFDDRWEGGIEVYAAWMKERLQACHRVLKPDGTIFLHCDWHASHHLRLALDEIFEVGGGGFINEIIWYYKTGGMSKRWFGRKHDTIFFYSKGRRYFFNPQKEKSYLMHKYGFSNIEIKEDEGGFYTMVGMRDVWDIPALRGNQPETLGYPTQKPEALLERIINGASEQNYLVLDPFCGCGTTIVVADRFKRNWIGIDISPTAVRVMKDRLSRNSIGNVEIIGLPTTIQALRDLKPFEFQNWVIRERFNGAVGPKGGDKGIDGYSFMLHEPIQVKQSDQIGRNVVDNFVAAMRRAKKRRGYIVAFSFGKGAYEEAAAVKHRNGGLEIILLTVEELLSKGAV